MPSGIEVQDRPKLILGPGPSTEQLEFISRVEVQDLDEDTSVFQVVLDRVEIRWPERLHVEVLLPVAETSSEPTDSGTASIVSSDTGLGSEGSLVNTVAAANSDSGLGTQSQLLTSTLSNSDTGQGTLGQSLVPATGSNFDTGAGVGAEQVTSALVNLDSGTGTDSELSLDTAAPSIPENLVIQSFTANNVELLWDDSTDDVGVAGYHVYRDGDTIPYEGQIVIATPHFLDYAVALTETHTYTVSAYDLSGKESPQSDPVSVTVSLDQTAPSQPQNLQVEII